MNVATALVFIGIAFLGVAAIAAIEELMERRCVRRDRQNERRALRQQAWREARLLDLDWRAR